MLYRYKQKLRSIGQINLLMPHQTEQYDNVNKILI